MIINDHDADLTTAEKHARRERDRRLKVALQRRKEMSEDELRAEESRLKREIAFRLLTGRVSRQPTPSAEADDA